MNNIYKVVFYRHDAVYRVVNTETGLVHSHWDNEPEAIGAMNDLNRWHARGQAILKQAELDKLPDNVIPFKPRKKLA